MRLDQVLPAAAGVDVEISGLAYDNRLAGPGTLFFCVPGFTRDGHEFAADAVARGAVALVVERPLELPVPQVRVPSVRAAMAPAAAAFYGDPTAALDVVGVTGTNGKTTTAFLVRELLEAAGRSTGLLGTVKSVIGGVEHEVERTTPEAIDLQRTFSEMRAAGDVACAIEVSSHALELHRADAIHFAAAVFTNLTQDHLDFHPTMEDYFAAKRRAVQRSSTPSCRRRGRRSSTSTIPTAPGWRPSSSDRSRSRCAPPAPTTAAPISRRAWRARRSPCTRPTARSRCGPRCAASSTSTT